MDLLNELEATWHTEIPISAAMAIEVVSFDESAAGDALTIRAALAPNVNVHGTAFAGSLYAIAALCGWGTVFLELKRRRLEASIVIADARIRYTRPVAEAIVARCGFDHAAAQESWQRLATTGKARFPLTVTIAAEGRGAATFEGEYAVRGASG